MTFIRISRMLGVLHKSQNLLKNLEEWHMPAIPALRRLKQEGKGFETNLNYMGKALERMFKKQLL